MILSANSSFSPEPLLQESLQSQRRFSIGLPRCDTPGERRFPLTPEGVNMLVERGFAVKMETAAGLTVNYPDSRYARMGAEIVSRREALGCAVVIHLGPLDPIDAQMLRRGALLMTLLYASRQSQQTITLLLARNVTAVALDLVEDGLGNTPFADILAEIDGRAAITLGASMLADPIRGKGILLGGVAGIVPCEGTIIGSGLAACAAARVAAGLGATVRMFDNDIYRLRRSARELGSCMVGSALQPHVVKNALQSADIVVVTDIDSRFEVDRDGVNLLKSGVVIFDITSCPGSTFPSLPMVDSTDSRAMEVAIESCNRFCIVNAGGAVARTAAMALSNTLVTTFDKLLACEGGINAALRLMPGLRRAVYTFMGHVVNPDVAAAAGLRQIDINIYLTLS